MKKKVIFISFDGILDNLGKSQITPYIFGLNKYYKMTLVTLENKDRIVKEHTKIRDKYTNNNIDWIKSKFSKVPKIGFFSNFLKVYIILLFLIVFKGFKYFHCRSLISATVCYYLNFFFKIQYIFDMRGFWIDEKSDRLNLSRDKISYKYLKFLENNIIQKSSSIISLTYEAKNIIQITNKINKEKIHVIPTCVDMKKFNRIKRLSDDSIINFCYMGTIDGAYDIKIIINYFNELNKKYDKAFLKILTNQKSILSSLLSNKNKNISYYSVNHEEIVEHLYDVDFGIFYLKNNYSIQASFPTKISEFLSLGIPIITNSFNLDIKQTLLNNKVGLLTNFDQLDIDNDLKKIIEMNKNYSKISIECKNYCKTNLSLDFAIDKYHSVYKKAFN